VHGYRYGTPADFVKRSLADGKIVFLEVDVQGGEKLLDVFPDGVYIFLLPPRFEVLEKRLRGRGTEDEAAMSRRLRRARDEMALANVDRYSYQVVNDDLSLAVDKLRSIVVAEKCRRFRWQATGGG
jgi:guanylate kinase